EGPPIGSSFCPATSDTRRWRRLIGTSPPCPNCWRRPPNALPRTTMKTPELGPWLHRFFREHLLTQRKVSPATIVAYRDTFRLLLRYLPKSRAGGDCSRPLAALKPDTVLRFLDHLERQRGNCVRTRNARLAAIRSFVHYLSDWLGPELPPPVARILGIPFKRQVQRLIGFLSRQEIETLLATTDGTWTGQRDHLLFLLLYNT